MEMTTDQQVALQFLKSEHVLHLATLNANNHPEVSSVVYGCNDDFKLIFAARSSSRKSNNLSHCSHVGFVVTNEDRLITIQGEGTVESVDDPEKIGRFLSSLAGLGVESIVKHWPPPILKINDGTYTIFEITPTWLRLADFSGDKPEDGSYFKQII